VENKTEALNKLRKWKWLYFASLTLPFVFFVTYIIYSSLYSPDIQRVLINQANSIYSNEDLSESNISEGKLKQILYLTLKTTFTFNYLSFVDDETYISLIKRERLTDLPDHRDRLKPLYSDDSYDYVISSLKSGEWMNQLYRQRRRIDALVSTPPVRSNISSGWEKSEDGRLNASYSGFLYLISESKDFKNQRYRIDYDVVMERKPNISQIEIPDYFYRPMVKPNTEEWRVKSIEWEVDRKQ
jgi:hypothetical protein